jgi:hypothetical protein
VKKPVETPLEGCFTPEITTFTVLPATTVLKFPTVALDPDKTHVAAVPLSAVNCPSVQTGTGLLLSSENIPGKVMPRVPVAGISC